MSPQVELKPTPRRLRFAAAIDRGEITGYPGWKAPKVFSRAGLDQRLATGIALTFLATKLAEWQPDWELAGDRLAEVPIRLTDAGKAWRAKHAETTTVTPSEGVL